MSGHRALTAAALALTTARASKLKHVATALFTKHRATHTMQHTHAKVFGGVAASAAARATFDAWHEAADAVLHRGADAESAMAAMRPHVHEACVFRPPTYYKSWNGRDETLTILGAVSEVFGTSFAYGRQWLSDDGLEWALEFTAAVPSEVNGGAPLTIHGIDLVTLCPETSSIVEFSVLARPPKAIAALKAAMGTKAPVIAARVAKLKAKRALGMIV